MLAPQRRASRMYVFREGDDGPRRSLLSTGASTRILDLDLGVVAPAGHYLALRVGFAFPVEEVNALPQPWVEHYMAEGYLLADPVMRWIYASTGQARWSEIILDDPRDVLGAARRHGLCFGAAVSLVDEGSGGQRSFGTFVRGDREFVDAEIDLVAAYLQARHGALNVPTNITEAELQALRLVKKGQRLKEVAWELGVTEGAVKQRLKSVRAKLAAKTGPEAVSRASQLKLI